MHLTRSTAVWYQGRRGEPKRTLTSRFMHMLHALALNALNFVRPSLPSPNRHPVHPSASSAHGTWFTHQFRSLQCVSFYGFPPKQLEPVPDAPWDCHRTAAPARPLKPPPLAVPLGSPTWQSGRAWELEPVSSRLGIRVTSLQDKWRS